MPHRAVPGNVHEDISARTKHSQQGRRTICSWGRGWGSSRGTCGRAAAAGLGDQSWCWHAHDAEPGQSWLSMHGMCNTQPPPTCSESSWPTYMPRIQGDW